MCFYLGLVKFTEEFFRIILNYTQWLKFNKSYCWPDRNLFFSLWCLDQIIQKELKELVLSMQWKFWKFITILKVCRNSQIGQKVQIFYSKTKNIKLKICSSKQWVKMRYSFTNCIENSKTIGMCIHHFLKETFMKPICNPQFKQAVNCRIK